MNKFMTLLLVLAFTITSFAHAGENPYVGSMVFMGKGEGITIPLYTNTTNTKPSTFEIREKKITPEFYVENKNTWDTPHSSIPSMSHKEFLMTAVRKAFCNEFCFSVQTNGKSGKIRTISDLVDSVDPRNIMVQVTLNLRF